MSELTANPPGSDAMRANELARRWREELEGISDEEIRAAQGLLAEALSMDAAASVYEATGDALRHLAREAERVSAGGTRLLRQFEALQASWRRARRYTAAGIDELQDELSRRAQRHPGRAATRWLAETLQALTQRDMAGAARVAAIVLPLEDHLQAGADDIRSAVTAAAHGDSDSLIRVLAAVGDATVDGWQKRLDDNLRSTAHRLAAWQSLEVVGDMAATRRHLDAAIELRPFDPRAYVDRSAVYRLSGEADLASRDAQRVIELDPESPRGYVSLGASAEAAGDFDQADHLYAEALERLATYDLAALRGDALLDGPSGRMLMRAAERTLAVRRPRAALELIERALGEDVAGPGHYPEAEAYSIRADVLVSHDPVPRSDVAAAALEAGKRYLWDGETEAAIIELRRAKEYSDGHDDSGWLLADALISAQDVWAPNPERTQEALETWTEWRKRYGPPVGAMAWAYVTRARIAEDAERERTVDRDERWWDALGYVERALVESDAHALRWVLRARYARNLRLLRIAAEALVRAETRDPNLPDLHGERLVLLATRDRLGDAAGALDDMEQSGGRNESTVVMRAYLFHLEGRDAEAIALLQRLISERPAPDFFQLLALCQLAVGDLDGALSSYRALLAQPAGIPLEVIRRAEFALGQEIDAWPTAECDPAGVDALVAYSRGDTKLADDLLAELIRTTPIPADAHELAVDFPLHFQLLPDDDVRAAAERSARAVLEEVVAERLGQSEHAEISADEELARAIEAVDAARRKGSKSDAPDVARAVQAHRLQDRGELDASARVYEALAGTAFDRMAQIALRDVLQRRSDELAVAREVERLDEVQAHLVALGATSHVDATLVVAPVLLARGRHDEARTRLQNALDAAASTAEDRARLLVALGEAAVVAGDLPEARRTFTAAIDIAERQERHARAAQGYVRLALVELLSRRMVAAATSVRRALAAWRRADAFEPEWLLVQEAQLLARGVLSPKVRDVLKPLLSLGGAEPQGLLAAGPEVAREPADGSPAPAA